MEILKIHCMKIEVHQCFCCSPSSLYFDGTSAVHEGNLTALHSGHEVLHVGIDGPGLASEVRFLIDHPLHTNIHTHTQVSIEVQSKQQKKIHYL